MAINWFDNLSDNCAEFECLAYIISKNGEMTIDFHTESKSKYAVGVSVGEYLDYLARGHSKEIVASMHTHVIECEPVKCGTFSKLDIKTDINFKNDGYVRTHDGSIYRYKYMEGDTDSTEDIDRILRERIIKIRGPQPAK